MADLPTGTVTFLLTDIEGSTALWERDSAAMEAATARHDALIEQAVAETRKAAEGDDVAKIKAAVQSLTQQSHKLAEQLYKQTGAEAAGASAAPVGADPAKPAGDVVDAEYTVKN